MTDRTQIQSGVLPTFMENANADLATGSALTALFPQAILDLGYAISRPLDASGGQADCYLLTGRDGRTVFGKVYRRGFRPKAEILARLATADPDHVIPLLQYDAGEDGHQAWELLEYAEFGTLGDFIRRQSGRSVDTGLARTILREMTTALEHIHGLDIEHRDIKPDNILIRNEQDFDLVLTDFGIASDNAQATRFTEHAHHSLLYAPPEAQHGHIARARWDYWSLGMILVELLTGMHPLLETGANPQERDVERSIRMRFLQMTSSDELVRNVQQDDWRKLCRGLLSKNSRHRWAGEDVARWLEDPADPQLVIIEEQEHVNPAGFRFGDKTHETVTQFAAVLRENREDLRHWWRIDSEYQRFEQWLGANGYKETQRRLAELRGNPAQHSLELLLMEVLHTLDDSQPPLYDGMELTLSALRELVDKAVAGEERATVLLRRLQGENVLVVAAGMATLESPVAAIGRNWATAARDYAGAATRLASASAGAWPAAPLADPGFAMFLAAMVPGCSCEGTLREQALTEANGLANGVTWFRAIGDAETSAPHELLLIVRSAYEARAIVERTRASIAVDAKQLWKLMGRGGLVALPVAMFGIWVAENFSKGSLHASPRNFSLIDWLFLSAVLTAWGASNVSACRQALGVGSDG